MGRKDSRGERYTGADERTCDRRKVGRGRDGQWKSTGLKAGKMKWEQRKARDGPVLTVPDPVLAERVSPLLP